MSTAGSGSKHSNGFPSSDIIISCSNEVFFRRFLMAVLIRFNVEKPRSQSTVNNHNVAAIFPNVMKLPNAAFRSWDRATKFDIT